MLDQGGPEAVKQWVLDQKKLLVTDTTMRDAHQSLLSTRMQMCIRDRWRAGTGGSPPGPLRYTFNKKRRGRADGPPPFFVSAQYRPMSAERPSVTSVPNS